MNPLTQINRAISLSLPDDWEEDALRYNVTKYVKKSAGSTDNHPLKAEKEAIRFSINPAQMAAIIIASTAINDIIDSLSLGLEINEDVIDDLELAAPFLDEIILQG